MYQRHEFDYFPIDSVSSFCQTFNSDCHLITAINEFEFGPEQWVTFVKERIDLGYIKLFIKSANGKTKHVPIPARGIYRWEWGSSEEITPYE